MSTIRAFDNIENKHTLNHGEDYIEKFCTFLREHATNVINFGKKENVTINKKRAKITPRFDGMLHLWKNILKESLLMIKMIEKLDSYSFSQRVKL